MQHTTRETAYKLHHAGFPEPMPAAGQYWWHPDYSESILCAGPSIWPGEYALVIPGPRLEKQGANFFVGAVFAPTATDILRELPGWSISRDETRDVWVVFMVNILSEDATTDCFSGGTPAEAAAAALLQLTEIEKEQDK